VDYSWILITFDFSYTLPSKQLSLLVCVQSCFLLAQLLIGFVTKKCSEWSYSIHFKMELRGFDLGSLIYGGIGGIFSMISITSPNFVLFSST
jgi:hypothetical protein